MPYESNIDKPYQKNLYGYIQNLEFKIPVYQRFYEWPEQLVSRFCKDIKKNIDRKSRFFLGIY
jgi:uncharacterized protein with ParB-like and HNH nuclease domain